MRSLIYSSISAEIKIRDEYGNSVAVFDKFVNGQFGGSTAGELWALLCKELLSHLDGDGEFRLDVPEVRK